MAELIEYSTAVVDVWGFPSITINDTWVQWHKDRRGRSVPTLLTSVARIDPFSFESATLTFPGFDVHLDRPGVGRWRWLTKDAPVHVAVVGDGDESDEDRENLFRGQVASWRPRTDGQGLDVICEGRLMPAGKVLYPPTSGILERETVEAFCKRVLDDTDHRRWLPLRFDPASVPTGIYYSDRGAFESRLAMVTDALASAMNADGDSWTIRYDEEKGPEFTKRVIRDTWTVAFGQPGMQADLTEDHRDVVHRVYGQGINAEGGMWRNTKYPNVSGADAPAYPSGSTLYYPGDSLPASVGGPFWQRMRELGYRVQSGKTQYLDADRGDVIDLQESAGVAAGPSGSFGPQTWAAAFQPGRDVALGKAIILPLAQTNWADPHIRNEDGAIVRDNPDHDRTRLIVDRFIDFGDGQSRRDAKQSARMIIRRESQPVISGTITLTADPRQGSRFRIRETDRLRVTEYMGETVDFWISRVDYSLIGEGTVTLQVSTRPGHYLTISEEIARNNSERVSRRQSNGRATRTPGVIWDAESPAGIISTTSHYPNLGSVTYIPVPVFGTIVRTRIRHDVPTEFIAALFEKRVTPAQIEAIIGGNPLTADPESRLGSDPVAGRLKAIKDLGRIAWWGTAANPLGYGEENKPEDPAEAAALLDGSYEEDAQIDFRLTGDNPGWLTLITWTREAAHTRGRFSPAAVGV